MDKATLLGTVIEQVKDLKRKSLEAARLITVPSDFDEATIDCYTNPQLNPIKGSVNNNRFIKISLCCEERPNLLADLNQALEGLKMTVVGGDIACLGGRIKSILVLCFDESGCVTSAIESLKALLRRITSFSSGTSCNLRSKRQRLFQSSY